MDESLESVWKRLAYPEGDIVADVPRLLVSHYRLRWCLLLAHGSWYVHPTFSKATWLTKEIVAQQWFDALGGSLYISWYVFCFSYVTVIEFIH